MSLHESNARLIGIDWGTSSLRVYLVGEHGQVLDHVRLPEGIMQVPDKDFEAVLLRLLDAWADRPRLPLIASGMITSRNGWKETPYLPAPTSATDLAAALVDVPLSGGKSCGESLHFVTCLLYTSPSPRD